MADKIVVMNDGNVEQVGSPLELYDTPVNRFVATFIGSPAMNMIDGTIRKDRRTFVETGAGKLPVKSGRSQLTDGQPVVYGIRPEHLELGRSGLEATVAVVEPTGPETLVFLRSGGQDLVALFRERHDFKPGQKVHLKPREELAHLFDTQSGARL